MALTFTNSSKSSNAVNKLLESVLPGHSSLGETSASSKSQIINSVQKKLRPEVARRIQKKEKLLQRQQVRQKREEREFLESIARYQLLKQHAKDGKLSREEKVELKKLVNKNIINLQSWRTDVEDEIVDLQSDILDLKKSDYSRKRSKKKITAQEVYKKKQEQRYPGLTPGLAPVGMSDSDSDDE